MKTFKYVAAALMLLAGIGNVDAGQFQKVTGNGQVRIHYPSSSPTACEVIMLGVGTAMSDNDYDNLAGKLNNFGYIVAIMDHQPGSLTKTDATKYKNLANEIKANLLTWLSGTGVSCTNGVAHWIMGGHSAGGQAAQYAVGNNAGLADAIFSIDPFDVSSAPIVSVPALYWGLDTTTCFVDKNKAGKAAYQRSSGQREFVRINVPYGLSVCGYSPKYFHCSFTDGTCPACTNCQYPPSSFYTEVATSVNKFINAAFYGTWSKANLNFSSNVPKTIFEGADAP
jgi:hypothetical protein